MSAANGAARSDKTVSVLVLDNYQRPKLVLLVLNAPEYKTLESGETIFKHCAWGMPTGRQEPEDEDDIATAMRECEEESGLVVEVYARPFVEESSPNGHINLTLVGLPAGGTLGQNTAEIIACRWFPVGVLYDANFLDPDHKKPIYSSHSKRAKNLLWRARR